MYDITTTGTVVHLCTPDTQSRPLQIIYVVKLERKESGELDMSSTFTYLFQEQVVTLCPDCQRRIRNADAHFLNPDEISIA